MRGICTRVIIIGGGGGGGGGAELVIVAVTIIMLLYIGGYALPDQIDTQMYCFFSPL